MQNVNQKPQTIKAFIYRQFENDRLLVDVRNVTHYTWERMAKFAREMDNAGRDYEIIAT